MISKEAMSAVLVGVSLLLLFGCTDEAKEKRVGHLCWEAAQHCSHENNRPTNETQTLLIEYCGGEIPDCDEWLEEAIK